MELDSQTKISLSKHLNKAHEQVSMARELVAMLLCVQKASIVAHEALDHIHNADDEIFKMEKLLNAGK